LLDRWRNPKRWSERYEAGIAGDLDAWLRFNGRDAFRARGGLRLVAPFPPMELMQNTTGLTSDEEFAAHGAHFVQVLNDASPKPLADHEDLLDFGVGVGRVARIFKGHEGRYTGVDIDARHVAWVASALDHVEAFATSPGEPLPFDDGRFDGVISISVFTHLDEDDHRFYLAELARVCRRDATVLLTVHGDRALARARSEASVFNLLEIPREELDAAQDRLADAGFVFVIQQGHLTTDDFAYGITFIARRYIETTWGQDFEVVDVIPGAIHDFQDLVVLRAR
jgi:SAM-dependent methyltransferase